MQHLRVLLAASLFVLAFDASAESRLLQDARPGAWARLAAAAEKLPVTANPSPKSVENDELGWLRSGEMKPGGSLQLELAKDVALCADWDRQRPKVAPLRETVDTFLLGLYFRF